MKIKRFNNLWTMGLIISAVLLLGVYIIKLFCPEWCVEIACSNRICEIGHYIDGHKWAKHLSDFIVSFFIYYFYCCACCGNKKISLINILYIIITIIIVYWFKYFLNVYFLTINYVSMICLPFILKAKFKNTTISFTVLTILQILSLEIRGLSLMISDYNIASGLILLIDYYIMIILLYFYFNQKKGD